MVHRNVFYTSCHMNKLLIFLTLISLNTYAQEKLGECSLQKNGPVIEAYPTSKTEPMNCDYVHDVENVFLNVQQFSEQKVSLSLMVQPRFDNASFDGGTIIEVPQELVFQGQYGQEYPAMLDSNLATVAHEYGHALLEKKMELELGGDFPALKTMVQKEQEISALKIAVLVGPTETNQALLADKVKALMNDPFYIRWANITTGLSELYADVVAVYNDNDKGAIMNALYYDQMSNQDYLYVKTRDFDTEFDSRYDRFMSEAHAYYALTRNYIGKNLWPTNTKQKQVMLKKIGDAIVAEVRNGLKNNDPWPEFKEGNKRLIARLSKK